MLECPVHSTCLPIDIDEHQIRRHLCETAAAVLADLPPGKGLEEEIEADLGTGASKVWKEVKLLLQPQGKCENKEHAGKVDGEEEFVCEEADCLLLWLEDKTFSVSARTALMAWALLLARSQQTLSRITSVSIARAGH